MELERQRQLELLHTPKSELKRMMMQNSLNVDEMIFLYMSNKINATDIRTYAPSICDKLLSAYLRQLTQQSEAAEVVPPMVAK